jgi:L-threonylcarbamoyladenylate synthase
MTAVDAAAFERCMSVGGVAVFPADTVYGLACDPYNDAAVRRLYALKRRSLEKPSAVMFFDVELALEALPELGDRTRSAFPRLLPGGVTLLLPNSTGRYPLACGGDPSTLGLRVPSVPAFAGVRWPVLQSSANLASGPEARRLDDVPDSLRKAADMVIDGGELPGTASTVVDLRGYETDGTWRIVRQGAVSEADVAAGLEWQFHFDPASYMTMMRAEIPAYDRFQDQLVDASGADARCVLELGTGTGETASRLLARHPDARLVGVDESAPMLDAARARLPDGRASLRVARLQERLPAGPFDLVASVLAVHHLHAAEKRELFERVFDVLEPGGRFVLADVVTPLAPAEATISLTPGFDHPSTVAEQVEWLAQAGFGVRVAWERADLAIMVAERPRD